MATQTAFARFISDETDEIVTYKSRASRPAPTTADWAEDQDENDAPNGLLAAKNVCALDEEEDDVVPPLPPRDDDDDDDAEEFWAVELGTVKGVCATPGSTSKKSKKSKKPRQKKTNKKKKLTGEELREAVRAAPTADARFLRDAIRQSEGIVVGVGGGTVVTMPQEWPTDDALRVSRWMETLGFDALSGRRLRLASKESAKLLRELALAETNVVARRRKDVTDGVRRQLIPMSPTSKVTMALADLTVEPVTPTKAAMAARKRRLAERKLRRVSSIGGRLSVGGRVSLGGGGRRTSVVVPRRSSVMPPLAMSMPEEEEENEDDEAEEQRAAKEPPSEAVMDLVLDFMGVGELLQSTPAVCRDWARLSAGKASLMCAHAVGEGSQLLHCKESFFGEFPSARFLSDGGFKRVYKVRAESRSEELAVSVMDYLTIAELGNEAVINTEIDVSFMVSSLVAADVCPNFVNCFKVFHLDFSPPKALWGCPEEELAEEEDEDARGSYIYTLMELCDADIEHHMKTLPDMCVPVDAVPSFVFQMAASLYSSRERFSMRHYDVKALNFLLKRCPEEEELVYGFDGETYSFGGGNFLVKLADFGTADTNEETLGERVQVAQFTTLENTPSDFLWQGNDARQTYAADTFALGLTVLHLFTGEAPYEEVMESVVCPPGLRTAVMGVWTKDRDFSVLRAVLEDDEDDILLDTFYRGLCLMGVGSFGHPKLVEAVKNTLTSTGTKRRSKAALKAAAVFDADHARFSLLAGTEPRIALARSRMALLPGALDLLLSMLSPNPFARPTMKEVMTGPMFEGFRVSEARPGFDHYGSAGVPDL